MTDRLLQPNLNGGELSDTLYGRVDIDRYKQALARCENFVVNPHGGVENRPGSEYIGLTKLQDGSTVRLVTFAPSADESYILEFGDQYLRVFDADGPVYIKGNAELVFLDQADPIWSSYVQRRALGAVADTYIGQKFIGDAVSPFEVGIVAFKMMRNFKPAFRNVKVAIYTNAAGLPGVPVAGLGFEDFQSMGDQDRGMQDVPFFGSVGNRESAFVYFKRKDPAGAVGAPAVANVFPAGTILHAVLRMERGTDDQHVSFYVTGAITAAPGPPGGASVGSDAEPPVFTTFNPLVTQEFEYAIFNNDPDTLVELATPWGATSQDDVGTESQISRLVFTQSVDVMTITDGLKQTIAYELRRYDTFWELLPQPEFVDYGAPSAVIADPATPAQPVLAPTRKWQYAVAGVRNDGKEGLPVLSAVFNVGSDISTIKPLVLEITCGDDVVDHYSVYKGRDGTFGYIGFSKLVQTDTDAEAQSAYWKAYRIAYDKVIKDGKDRRLFKGAGAKNAVIAAAEAAGRTAGEAAAALVSSPVSVNTTKYFFADENIAPDFTDQPRSGINPFNESGGLTPACVAYFQQRLVFANWQNKPDTLMFSEVSDYTAFQRTIPTVDDDAIEATLAQGQLNEIRFLVPLRDLLVLTTGAEHILTGAGKPVSPSNLDTAPVSQRGVGTMHPLVIGNVILFKDIGGHIREWIYEQQTNDYPGTDVGMLASHLFKDAFSQLPIKVTEWCYVSSPTSVVCAVRADGMLLTFTYVREQNVAAWARHTTAGKYRSVVSARNMQSEGETVWTVVERIVNGTRTWMIERTKTRNERLSPFSDSAVIIELDSQSKNHSPAGEPHWTFIDPLVSLVSGAEVQIKIPALVFPGAFKSPPVYPDFNGDEKRWIVLFDEANGKRYTMRILEDPAVGLETTYTVRLDNTIPAGMEVGDMPYLEETGRRWELGAKRFDGLDHLEGEEIAIRADDGAHAPLTVAGGSVTLNLIANRFSGGLPYWSTIRTLPLASPQSDIKSRQKLVNSIGVDVARTKGVWAGEILSNLTEKKPDILDPTLPDIGRIDIRASNKWGRAGMVYVQNRDPLPCSILAVSPEVTLGG